MHAMQLAGRIDHGASAPFHNRANDPVLSRANAKSGRFLQLNAARQINHIRHVGGNTSPGFCISRQGMHAANILDCSIDCNIVLANA